MAVIYHVQMMTLPRGNLLQSQLCTEVGPLGDSRESAVIDILRCDRNPHIEGAKSPIFHFDICKSFVSNPRIVSAVFTKTTGVNLYDIS